MVNVIQVCRQLSNRIRMERSSILILFESCLQTCMTYTIAVCTVKNSWWWTEEISETCRISFQNKFEKLSASSWFYYNDLSSYLHSFFGLNWCSYVTRQIFSFCNSLLLHKNLVLCRWMLHLVPLLTVPLTTSFFLRCRYWPKSVLGRTFMVLCP